MDKETDKEIWFPSKEVIKPKWSHQDAAAVFFASRDKFLDTDSDNQNPIGDWELSCFAMKDLIGKEIVKADVWNMRKFVHSCRNCYDRRGKFYTVTEIKKLFEEQLAYPPAPLSSSQDKKEVERKAFAVKIFRAGWGFKVSSKK